MSVVVHQSRGGLSDKSCVESFHPVSVFAVREGELVCSEGPDLETAFRSASKPMQLAVSLAHLGDPDDLSPQELAVGAASHSAEPQHLQIVEQLLARFGCTQEQLRCGAHPPMHTPSAERVLRAGGSFCNLHNNCSGKHAFMLAASKHEGWPLDYRDPDHPLQLDMRAQMGAWMQHEPALAIDGCGVPTFVQPLSRAARAWSELAAAMAESDGDAWSRRLHRIGWAMAEHPELSSGTGRLDVDIVRHAREPIAVKIGAAGLFCIAHPGTRTGITVKVHSGVTEALPVAVEWALARVLPELFERPSHWELALVRNVVGREVGSWAIG